MDVVVRVAEADDLPALVALASVARRETTDERGGAALLAELGLPTDPTVDLARSLDDPATMVWCATLDGVTIGYLVASTSENAVERVVLVREVWVDEEAREIGAGEALVSAALAWAIAEDADAIDAIALPGSRAMKNLYERLGLTARALTVRRSLR